MSEFSPDQLAKVSNRLTREVEAFLADRTVEPHYSAEQTAELLSVTVRTIWNYVDAGERTAGQDGIFPVVKLSHKVVRIPASSINRFLKARTIAAPAKQLQEAHA